MSKVVNPKELMTLWASSAVNWFGPSRHQVGTSIGSLNDALRYIRGCSRRNVFNLQNSRTNDRLLVECADEGADIDLSGNVTEGYLVIEVKRDFSDWDTRDTDAFECAFLAHSLSNLAKALTDTVFDEEALPVREGPEEPVSAESLKARLHARTSEERIAGMSAERRQLYERIQAFRTKLGPIDFDIVEALKEIRDADEDGD